MAMQDAKRYFRDADADKTFADLDHRGHALYRLYIMKEVSPKEKRCLDVGCGWGRFLRDYVSHGASLTVGVDINLGNLIKCKEVKGAGLVRADVENLPFRSGTFDVVSCTATMEHIPNPSRAMDEFIVVARKDGLVCVTWNHYNWLTALWNPHVRSRLRGALRDVIGRYLKPLRKQSRYRSKGFSPRQVISLNRGLKLESFIRFNLPGGYYLVSIGKKVGDA